MAKRNNEQPPPAGGANPPDDNLGRAEGGGDLLTGSPEGVIASTGDLLAGTGGDAGSPGDDAGTGAGEGPANGAGDQDDGDVPGAAAETVQGLVLYDSIYGKCGEVKPFPADQAEAIQQAGYIDTHPNAIKSVE